MNDASQPEFERLRLRIDGAIARMTLAHPPMNLLDESLLGEFARALDHIEAHPQLKVLIIDSADPEFFIAHADVGWYLAHGQAQAAAGVPRPVTPSASQQLLERLRRLRVATIAEVAGRVRGGGSCLVLAMDMCFAAQGKASFGHPEIAVGLIPAIGGTQRLPRRIGRARALEIILGGDVISADLAERYGYINRALPADELSAFVNRLAQRIASYPALALQLAKQAVSAAEQGSLAEGLMEEADCFNRAAASPDAQRRMAIYLQAAQSRDFELRMQGFVQRLATE